MQRDRLNVVLAYDRQAKIQPGGQRVRMPGAVAKSRWKNEVRAQTEPNHTQA
jgi:hypothetical protein